jgi:DNA-binding XRE family transcriptional regulator
MEKEVSPLAMLRKIRGDITQRELAEALDVSETTVRNWEAGRAKPSLSITQTKKLCKILGLPLDQIPDNFGPQPIHESLSKSFISDFIKSEK